MRKLWFLRRNINLCSPETKLTAYKTIIRPMLEYACIVWDPHTKLSIDMLETVQKKNTLQFVYNHYGFMSSVSDLYPRSGLSDLATQRKTGRLKFLYNMIQGNLRLRLCDYTSFNETRPMRGKHQLTLVEPLCGTTLFKASFFPRTTCEWNKLLESVLI